MDIMDLETGVSVDLGMVCKMKKQKRKRQKLVIVDMFVDFAKNTTLHGLRYITEVGLTIAEKIFWIITFLISLGLCLWCIQQVWHKWRYSPVIVAFNERMISVDEIPFPSITICPQTKCKLSEYEFEKQYKRFYQNSSYGLGFRHDNEFDGTHEEEKRMVEDAILICNDDDWPLLKRNVSDVSLVNHIKKISPKIFQMFSETTWRGKYFSEETRFNEVLTQEGLCFNYNSLSHEDMFRNESLQSEYKYLSATRGIKDWDFMSGYSSPNDSVYPLRGQENGASPDLVLVLYDEPGDSDEHCNSDYNGFKIYIQHPADMPQSSMYYYAAVPGQVTSLALKFSVLNTSSSLEKYQYEQRQCYFPEDHPLDYFKIYTSSNCRLECLSKYTYKKCGCVWFHMPHGNSSELCTVAKKSCATEAIDEVASKSMKHEMGETCKCLPACVSVEYDAEIIKASFDFKKKFIASVRPYDKSKRNEDMKRLRYLDRFNFTRVEMYFKKPQFVSIRRSELFGLTDFLANCGGLLGLFLGFSFLSLVEIFYFCTLRLWCTLKKDNKIEENKIKESIYKR